jgi:putative transposase
MARPQRIAGFNYVGPHRYFLTICTHRREPRFTRPDVVASAMLQFRRTAAVEGFTFPAYCWMPDHLHLLVEGTAPPSDLKRFTKLAKQRSGAVYKRRNAAPLWQEGYYDRVLRNDDDMNAIARYILENPVRAGLAASPGDYPFLGSDLWSLKQLFEGVY